MAGQLCGKERMREVRDGADKQIITMQRVTWEVREQGQLVNSYKQGGRGLKVLVMLQRQEVSSRLRGQGV